MLIQPKKHWIEPVCKHIQYITRKKKVCDSRKYFSMSNNSHEHENFDPAAWSLYRTASPFNPCNIINVQVFDVFKVYIKKVLKKNNVCILRPSIGVSWQNYGLQLF